MGGCKIPLLPLTKVFKAINAKASGIRGQRPIALTKTKVQVKGLELNK
jgi:hypothetical protein